MLYYFLLLHPVHTARPTESDLFPASEASKKHVVTALNLYSKLKNLPFAVINVASLYVTLVIVWSLILYLMMVCTILHPLRHGNVTHASVTVQISRKYSVTTVNSVDCTCVRAVKFITAILYIELMSDLFILSLMVYGMLHRKISGRSIWKNIHYAQSTKPSPCQIQG